MDVLARVFLFFHTFALRTPMSEFASLPNKPDFLALFFLSFWIDFRPLLSDSVIRELPHDPLRELLAPLPRHSSLVLEQKITSGSMSPYGPTFPFASLTGNLGVLDSLPGLRSPVTCVYNPGRLLRSPICPPPRPPMPPFFLVNFPFERNPLAEGG